MSASFYLNRGVSLWNFRRYSDSISDYNKAIRIDPKYGDAYLNRAMARAKNGERESAGKDIFRTAELGVREAREFIQKYNITDDKNQEGL